MRSEALIEIDFSRAVARAINNRKRPDSDRVIRNAPGRQAGGVFAERWRDRLRRP
jgi:hypothetical protein